MNIQEIRRANLKTWAEANGVPPNEKSYFSQIINGGGSFGERAARRLEKDYKMGTGFLDKSPQEQELTVSQIPNNYVDAAEISKLLALYIQSTPLGRVQMMESAESAQKVVIGGRRDKASND